MSEQSLVTTDGKSLVKWSETAETLREDALAKSALIPGTIKDPSGQSDAAAALAEINRIASLVEKVRVELKDPGLKFHRHIDEQAKTFTKDLREEKLRITTAIANYQALEQAKARAAQQAENQRLAEIERQRAAEIAKAKTLEQADAVRERYAEEARQQPPIVFQAPTAKGLASKADWEVTVYDIHMLARVHPNCVKIEPLISEIKNLIKMGVKEIKGVHFKEKVNVSVRASHPAAAIDV